MTALERAEKMNFDFENAPNYLTVKEILIPHIEAAEREAWNAAIEAAAQAARQGRDEATGEAWVEGYNVACLNIAEQIRMLGK